MQIIKPSLEQLSSCFSLEQSYACNSPAAAENGFFLPGTSFSTYETLYRTGYIRAAVDSDKELAAFVLAVPPDHEILRSLLSKHEAFDLKPGYKPDPSASVWIAKVAANPAFRRMGFAKSLYGQLFKDFSGLTVLTATALKPLRNTVSENFHRSINMIEIGTYTGSMKDSPEKTVNIVWKYAG